MKSENVSTHSSLVGREARYRQNGHRSAIVWLTGLSGAGKSTIAFAVEKRLHSLGCRTYVLDGDNLRHGLCGDLGFSGADRSENIRRIGEVAKLMMDAGIITLAAFISPYRADREQARAIVAHGEFLEVYCRCDLEVCMERDVKGLYKLALAGKIGNFTGISSPYDPPPEPELTLDTMSNDVNACVDQVLGLLYARGLLPEHLARNLEPGR